MMLLASRARAATGASSEMAHARDEALRDER